MLPTLAVISHTRLPKAATSLTTVPEPSHHICHEPVTLATLAMSVTFVL